MQYDNATMRRSARRASYGNASPTGRRGSASSPYVGSGSSWSPSSPTSGSTTIAVGPRQEESYGMDTWTSFLWQTSCVQQAEAKCTADDVVARAEAATRAATLAQACSPPPVGTLRKADMLAAMQSLVAQQNRELVSVRQETLARRRAEIKQHSPSPSRSSPPAETSPTAESSTQAGPEEPPEAVSANANFAAAAAAAPKPNFENTLTVSVLARLLDPCRELWQAKLSDRFSLITTGPTDASTAPAGDSLTGSDRRDVDAIPLPTSAELLQCLLDGLHGDATRRFVASDLLGVDPASLTEGLDSRGLFTSFQPSVYALTSMYTSMAPTLKQLRERYFSALDPAKVATAFTGGFLESTMEVMEAQLDTLLRSGSSVEAISGLLLEGVHPSLRRLVYARALQLALCVTDGEPLFKSNGTDLRTNTPAPGLPAYLSCGSKYARDKVRRRYHHYHSSPAQEAVTQRLQASFVADNLATTGNDERYFVFEEEVSVLGAALVADKSVPDAKLKTALLQLGHDEDTFEAYITFLAQKTDDWVVQKAPPCGFVPLSGTPLLIAPLAYVTGDTTEQYELLSAMFSQIWCRLQGPTPELLQCCWLFEYLVATLAPQAVLHAARVLEYPALRLAVEWMTTGFAGILEPSELLLLWDVLMAFHARELVSRSALASVVGLANCEALAAETAEASPEPKVDTRDGVACALWILPLFAAGLFVWRAPLIEACHTPVALHDLFATGHNIRARAVLQQMLFLMDA